jgi:tRNA dimethylallyltransferase
MQLAERNQNVELISIDSAQVYRDMNIGTAKPSADECARVRHHLLDTISPAQQWSVKQYCDAFNTAVNDIEGRGKTPLVVGGTMMYVSALIDGISDVPTADMAIRQTIEARADQEGWPAMHAQLQRVDPETAQKLAPNDAQRISRALEVFEATGRPLSAFQGAREPLLKTHRAQLMLLEPSDRSVLHERIAQRFDAMLSDGLVDELVGLRRTYELTAQLPSMRCVGYRQAWQYLEREISDVDLREQGIAATRQLAKRQLTWQRHQFSSLAPMVIDPLMPKAFDQVRSVFDGLSTG